MSLFLKDPVEQATSLLKSFMPDVFRVCYDSDFPRREGGTARWFQVIFAVGPGDGEAVRTQVHSLFERILPVLSDLTVVREADQVSLRARRRGAESSSLVMFIESSWAGSAIATLRERRDFTSWATECSDYVNWFDLNDPLNKGFASKRIK